MFILMCFYELGLLTNYLLGLITRRSADRSLLRYGIASPSSLPILDRVLDIPRFSTKVRYDKASEIMCNRMSFLINTYAFRKILAYFLQMKAEQVKLDSGTQKVRLFI